MDKKRMKRMIGIAIPMALIITGISYNGYIRTHTFTLSGGVVKNELIQPINNKIKVSGNADTDVIFTDIEVKFKLMELEAIRILIDDCEKLINEDAGE